MEDRLPRKLAAILYADVAGYSRLTGEDEDATHRALSEYLDLISTTIESHGGQVMHYAGDAVLAKFDAVVDTMSAAIEIQNKLTSRNEDLPEERRVEFRIGVNSGDVIEDRGDIYGDGVNVAARLEALAEPGGICISDAVRTAVGKKLELTYEDMGEQEVKNIAETVRAYKVVMAAEGGREETAATPELELPDSPSIAVLPFTNMSGDPEQEHFSDGITEDIITALSRISGLLVIARNSTMVYKGKAVDVKQVGREQGVQYVLEGSVRKGGNRVRVTAQLVQAETGHHRWAEHYDRELDDIFAVQDEVTRNVTVEMQVQLTEGEQARIRARGTENVEAWEHMMRAMDLCMPHIKEDNLEARRLLERAVQLDSEYAAAWTWLGWTHWVDQLYGWGESREKSLHRAFECGETAMRLDASYPDSFALLGASHWRAGQFDEAVEMTEKSVKLAPNHSFNTLVSALVLRVAARYPESIQRFKRAMRLCPIYPYFYPGLLGSCYHMKGDNHLAIITLKEAVQRESESLLPKMWLASTLIELQSVAEAKAVVADILRIDPAFTIEGWLGGYHLKDPSVANRLLENLGKAGLPA